jgi:hypothetical protein
MAKQVVNVGTSPNSGGGDPLRDAMIKINENFTEVYDDIADLNDGIIVSTIEDTQGNVLVDATTGTISASALTGNVAGNLIDFTVNGTPDTLDGYGITDAYTKLQVYTKEEVDDLFGVGDLKGSLFADDSTLLVDGVNGTIPAANLSGALPALDASALTNIDAANITGSLSGVAVSTADITGYGVFTGTEESFATLTGATGTVTHDCDNGHIFYHTTPAADWTANFTNLGLTAEYATTLSIVIDQGATAYIPTAVEIGGVAQTLLWQGGSAPSGTADGTDVVAFSILNDGGTYVVMGQLVGFS